MAKPLLNTADIKIDQNDAVGEEREPTIVAASEQVLKDRDYLERINLADEPVVVRLLPSGERNPPSHYHCAVNGKGVEILIDNKWLEFLYAPVNIVFTTKVKYAAVWSMAKIDNIQTIHEDSSVAMPRNTVQRSTSAVANYELMEASDRGRHFLYEMRQRQA